MEICILRNEHLQFAKQKVCNSRNEKSVLILRNEQVEV